ncbi:MAG: PEP/pyruvate-binding domain-containing protein [Patescibacteria group bacterium]
MKTKFSENFKKLSKKDVGIAGGKGASLGEMTKAGILVPPGFVVLSSDFDRFLEETDLEVEIESILKKVKADKIHSVDSASNKIRDLIHDAEFPKDIADEILKEFKKLNAEYVAVRSSATAEDSSVASWAGELESYLNTNSKNLLDNVKKCWSSLFTPRAIFYRFEKGLDKRKVSVAVVIQKMIQSEISGICFTVHPVTEDRNQMVIEAGYGLGEAIVGGKITPDTYVIDKKKMKIMDKNISNQSMMIVRNNNGIKEVKISKNIQEKQKFSDKKIMELAKICIGIEKHYKKPQDIEWAFEKGKIYIVQSRPITTL